MYYSKRDKWLGLLIFGAMGYATIRALIELGLAFHSMLMIIVCAFVCWIWFGTYYKIDQETLYVCCGPIRKKVDIGKIEQIRDTYNPLSAPALSLDRIEIRGEGVFLLISPAEKEAFIAQLKEINRRIVYISRKTK